MAPLSSSNWLNVLFVTSDFEIKEKISKAFNLSTTHLKIVDTSEKAIEFLTDNPVDVVIIDAKATNTKVHYSEDKEIISFLEIAQYANHLNNHLPIVILANALLSKDGRFASKCGATLIMDRKDISLDKIIYVLRVLRKRTYRTILTRDLRVGQAYPVDIYHYLSANRKYLVFLRAGEPFTEEKKAKIGSSETRHLYVKTTELNDFLTVLRLNNKVCFSEELSHIQSQFRKMLIDIFNVSTDGALHFGNMLLVDGMSIVDNIEKLIAEYPDPHTCLKELPYPRWSSIAHGINSAIYALIFAKACELESAKEIAFASLIHNIGSSEIDQEVLKKKESDLTPLEFEEYKKHVMKSLGIIQRKKMLISSLVEKIIREHHENYDGTGFPNAVAGANLSLEPALLSVLGSFDYLNTIRDGEKAKTIYEVWELVKKHHAESTKLNKKFHPKIIEMLDKFFTST